MFDTLKEIIRRWVKKMFNKNTIETKMNVDIAVSNDMSNAIDLWTQLYEDNAPWVNNKTVFSMNTAAGIARTFAKLVTIEFKSEILNNEFLNNEYQKVVDKIRIYTEYACAKGGLVFKPYVSNGSVEIETIQSDMFFPTSFNSRGDILGAVFVDTKVVGDITYTKLEYHELIQNNYNNPGKEGYSIKNVAFKKKNYNQIRTSADNSLGNEIPLTEVQEWAGLEPEVIITNVDRPLFAYFKMPFANNIDSASPLGVSVYSLVAKDILKKVDEQYSRIDWEYKGSELGIDIDADMLKKDEYGNPIMPQGKERLYRKLDIDPTATGTSQWNVFSPAIRDASLYNGLQHQLRTIEFLCGLAYGTISDPNNTDKTATEIKASKQNSYQTISDIQKAQQNSLKDLAYAMSIMGQLYKLPVKPIDTNKDMTFTYGDSIMTDTDKDNDSMYLDVSSGIIKPLYYIMKKYKVTEEVAKTMMQDEVVIPPTPFDNTPNE